MAKKSDYSIKKNYEYINRRKQVLQNSPESFRPDNDIKEYLEYQKIMGRNVSEIIKQAIQMFKKNPEELLDELSLKYPHTWRRINRRNGKFISQKISSLKKP